MGVALLLQHKSFSHVGLANQRKILWPTLQNCMHWNVHEMHRQVPGTLLILVMIAVCRTLPTCTTVWKPRQMRLLWYSTQMSASNSKHAVGFRQALTSTIPYIKTNSPHPCFTTDDTAQTVTFCKPGLPCQYDQTLIWLVFTIFIYFAGTFVISPLAARWPHTVWNRFSMNHNWWGRWSDTWVWY